MMRRKVMLGVSALAVAALIFAPRALAERQLLDFGTSIKNRVYAVIEVTDQSEYGGFFKNNGLIDYLDILALFQHESAWNIKAIRANDGGVGNHAYGLGQMLESTGRDMGYTPAQLLELGYSVQATMKYLKFIHDYLSARISGLTRSQLLGAYNVGIGNVSQGKGAASIAVYMGFINAAKLTLSI